MTESKVAVLIGYFIGIWGVTSIHTKPDSPYHYSHVSDSASGATTEPRCKVKMNLSNKTFGHERFSFRIEPGQKPAMTSTSFWLFQED